MTTATHSPPTVVGEFLSAELPDTDDRDGRHRAVRMAAIGTTADKPLKSPLLRQALAAADFEVASAEALRDAESLVADLHWDIGIVLSPYKLAAAGLVDQLSPSARQTGVVDTMFTRGGRTYGVNSNTWAVLAVLRRLVGTTAPARVLVLGSGGSTRSTVLAVRRAWPGAACTVSARRADAAEAIATQLSVTAVGATDVGELAADVVINTTTWGETAASEATPFAFDLDAVLRPGVAYFDLNNRRSALAEHALDAGCVVMTGNFMQRVTHECRAAGLRRWMDAS